jgi:NADP-dependent 3-hydroxy acid dehydrogenase YdfG
LSGGIALVTGASSGIGRATARRLSAEDYFVYCADRRLERIQDLEAEIRGVVIACDVTNDDDVASLASAVGQRVDVLVNNAGVALGMSTVEESDPDDWRLMYELNVLGALRVTRALLPAIRASKDSMIINVGSTAGHEVYEREGGYVASKHALASMTESLRRELLGQPIRVCEIAPGMVHTEAEELSLKSYGGERRQAEAVCAGVESPLTEEDVAECIAWVVSRPSHVNVDLMIVRSRAQIPQ